MMDGFNPLDLLASAAELQQKHDDGPERIIISRQKRHNAAKIYVNTNEQKENRELSNNSNITKTKPSVVIVKKIRKSGMNLELEKMLDEHNYGNAKRNYSKMEKSLDSATESNEEKRQIIDKVLDISKTSEQTISDRQIVGKVCNLITNSSLEICDSENVLNSNIGSSGESSCFNGKCADYQGNLEHKCSECDIPENKEIKISQQNFSIIRSIDESNLTSNELIMKCDEKEQKNYDTFLTESNSFSFSEDGVELNEQTGEFIYKKVSDSTMKHSSVMNGSMPDELSNVAASGVKNICKPKLKFGLSGKLNFENKAENHTTLGIPKSLANMAEIKTLDVSNMKTFSVRKHIGLPANNISEVKKTAGLNITQTCTEPQNSDVLTLKNRSISYNSFKDLEIENTLCADDASTSVHLLSPDSRNPDSVEIGSPKTHYENEFCLENQDFYSTVDQGVLRKIEKKSALTKSLNEIDEPSKISLQSVEENLTNSVSSSHLASCPNYLDTQSVETVTDCRELNIDSGLLFTDKVDNCKNIANNTLLPSASENCIFRLDSDHCYAGVQGKVNTSGECEDIQNEREEVKTPQGSLSEWSQDSGYEDVTQSPEIEQQQTMSAIGENTEKPPALRSLVPVLVSLNKNGSLTVHDNNLTRTLGGSIFFNENMKFITGTNLTSISKVPLTSSVGKVSSPLPESLKNVKSTPESVIGVLSPKKQDLSETIPQEMSPPKYGKFRIGTFASFSNTGVCSESPASLKSLSLKEQDENKSDSNFNLNERLISGKCSPIVNTLGSLVQKVKSSLLPACHNEQNVVDHIQHDHDYCTKNLMPSVVNSFLEARLLSKDNVKGKVTHAKGKKSDSEYKTDGKSLKRKRNSLSVTKEETSEYFDVDSECDTLGIHPSFRQKYRTEKYIESKRTDPKVKITGSSNFQDQFVYFMNTKKRSRRRESKDIPIPNGTDRVFIPPKPGDIVVPHLTDQDIENLKLRSKQGKNSSSTPCSNNLRNEFMAAKLSNGVFPSMQPPETVDDEKTIINTILSLENEDLVSPNQSEPVPYNESMEMYGQGLNADIMSLLPEQMNLTPEQIDMLYSAVDEVQNSTPDLVEAHKLRSRDISDSAAYLQSDTYNDLSVACSTTISECEADGAQTLISTDISKESVICTESEKDEKDANYLCDVRGKFESSGDMNDIEQMTQNRNEKKRPAVKEGICDAANASTDDPVSRTKNDLDVLSLNSDSSNTLKILHEPYGKNSSASSKAETTIISSEKTLISTVTLDSARSSTLESDITSVSSSTLTPEMSIPHIDKSLYLLGNDLDKGDLFPDGSVAPPAQVDYNAPWIVTVSMYWNDLPAIMIFNQPFVRLVDIHKQILPAKDTGILKKRCQLMNIEVDNCSEMQRYFLVQYGKAFNSKSTLIISKDDAKILIGYYVDPQPKILRPEDHKSVVDHRREQLRRIALARRSAIRAQRLAGKKADLDPRDIRQSKDDVDVGQPIHCSLQEQSKKFAKLPSSLPYNQTADDCYSRQRATRHKKINFLEMLRGDASCLVHGEESVNEHVVKHKVQLSESKKKRKMKEKKLKVAKYTIETDSSEETDSVLSDYNSGSSDTDSNCVSDLKVLKRAVEKKLSPIFLAKVKHRVKGVSKPFRKRNLKRGLKQPKPSLTSTPLAIQVVNKPMAVSKLIKSVYKPTLSLKSRKELPKRRGIICKNLLIPEKVDIDKSKDINQKIYHDCVIKDTTLAVSASKSKGEIIKKSVNIAATNIEPSIAFAGTVESLNTNDIQGQNTDNLLQSYESVTVQTDSVGFENNKGFLHIEKIDKIKEENTKNENFTIKENNIGKNCKSQSESLENSSLSVMKRKSNVQIRSDETPVRIIHREVNPQVQKKMRSQLGELFVDHYQNKRSLCVRCYTCRKLMSVDNFLHHLHDVSGGLLSVTSPQIIDLSDQSLNENESKLWETFLRKKELFDNNQLPSDSRDIGEDNLVYDIKGESSNNTKHSIDEKNCQPGPRIIMTPVSPVKTEKILHKQKSEERKKSKSISNQWSPHITGFEKQKQIIDDTTVRTSSRKRKMKHHYGFENYSFTKFPRLMKNAVVEDEDK